MIVYAVLDDALSPDFPLGDALEVSSAARTLSGSSRKCAGDDPEAAAKLRVEERELETGGLN